MRPRADKTVFVFSGPLGPRKHGNQTLKNTLLGYLAAGYEVHHFTVVALRDAGHDFRALRRHPAYVYHGMPIPLLSLARDALRRVRRPGAPRSGTIPRPEDVVDLGRSEVTGRQVMFARVYACFEFLRGLPRVLLGRPSLLYGFEVYGAPVASALGRLRGIRTVLRFQGTYVTRANASHPPIRYHLRALRGHADGIVMGNDGTRGDEVLRRLGVDPRRTLFIVNGIDGAILSSAPDPHAASRLRGELSPPGCEMLLGIFNRFYPFKRIDRAIALLARLRDEGLDAHLVIGGHGGPLEHQLKALIDRRGLGRSVTWRGRVPHAQMPLYYRACDAILVMNDYANTGNQIFESLYLGRPLVAIDDGVNSRLFGDCRQALFVSPADLLSLGASALRALVAARGAYSSPHLMGWPQRMRREVQWVEAL